MLVQLSSNPYLHSHQHIRPRNHLPHPRKSSACVALKILSVGSQKYIEAWGLASEQELKQLDKEAKADVDAAVDEAKANPEPELKDMWTDTYYKGIEPPMTRGREREEVSYPWIICW